MPIHDWTKVKSGLFHHFRQTWSPLLAAALNSGRLPSGYSALVEQRTGEPEPEVIALNADFALDTGGQVGVLERPRTR